MTKREIYVGNICCLGGIGVGFISNEFFLCFSATFLLLWLIFEITIKKDTKNPNSNKDSFIILGIMILGIIIRYLFTKELPVFNNVKDPFYLLVLYNISTLILKKKKKSRRSYLK